MTEEPEDIGGKGDVAVKDYVPGEASTRRSKEGGQRGTTDLSMKRTVSFQPGHYKPSRSKKGRARSSTLDSIDTDDTEDSDNEDPIDDDDDDDDTIDDGTSTIMTDASDVTDDDELLTDDVRRKRSRFTPGFVAKRRERRRRRRAKEEREAKAGPKKVYRRTPVLSGVIAPFSIMLEVSKSEEVKLATWNDSQSSFVFPCRSPASPVVGTFAMIQSLVRLPIVPTPSFSMSV